MKRVLIGLGAAASVSVLVITIGCSNIRDYSVNSYQGVMPVGDFRPTGSLAPTTLTNAPKPSIPSQPPEAAPTAASQPISTPATPR